MNVDYYLCDGNQFNLLSEHFNVIFLVTVIGEIEHQGVYLQEFHWLLKPGGLLSFSEQTGDPDKLSVKEIRFLAEGIGFSFERFYGSERNYTINFRKQQNIACVLSV